MVIKKKILRKNKKKKKNGKESISVKTLEKIIKLFLKFNRNPEKKIANYKLPRIRRFRVKENKKDREKDDLINSLNHQISILSSQVK